MIDKLVKPRSSQLLVAIDGFDGSGKTTLAGSLKERFRARGLSCAIVGRKIEDSDGVVDQLTRLVLHADGAPGSLSPGSNVYVRLARLSQRIHLARESEADVVLFDRWVASDLSRIESAAAELYGDQFTRLHEDSGVSLTIRLRADFETVWARITDRPFEQLSPSEQSGRERNQALFARLDVIWDQWGVAHKELDSAAFSAEAAAELASGWIDEARRRSSGADT